MFTILLVSLTPASKSSNLPASDLFPDGITWSVAALRDGRIAAVHHWMIFGAAIFLVSVPVFLQAPLVRLMPWMSLGLTPVLVLIGFRLLQHAKTALWGDLLLGFTWTWLSGSIYWGWLRWEPFLHLPVEAMGLPFVLLGLWRGWGKVGNLFYLGSLLGTGVTDLYFYIVNLIPHWRGLMRAEPEQISVVFQSAIAQMATPWGLAWAGMLAAGLLFVSLTALTARQVCWWGFSGAVLSTILVDSLFGLTALLV